MTLITDVQPRKKSQKAIYIDGEFYSNVDLKTFLESRFKRGSEISAEELEDLICESNFRRAKERALYLLGYRDYAKRELQNKLKLEYGDAAASAAVSRMEELGFINDEVYTRNYAKKLFNTKNYAAKRVKYELLQKGIAPELVDQIVFETEPDSKEKIVALLEGKYRAKLSNEKDIKRTVATLQRLGYKFDDIKVALQIVCNED